MNVAAIQCTHTCCNVRCLGSAGSSGRRQNSGMRRSSWGIPLHAACADRESCDTEPSSWCLWCGRFLRQNVRRGKTGTREEGLTSVRSVTHSVTIALTQAHSSMAEEPEGGSVFFVYFQNLSLFETIQSDPRPLNIQSRRLGPWPHPQCWKPWVWRLLQWPWRRCQTDEACPRGRGCTEKNTGRSDPVEEEQVWAVFCYLLG